MLSHLIRSRYAPKCVSTASSAFCRCSGRDSQRTWKCSPSTPAGSPPCAASCSAVTAQPRAGDAGVVEVRLDGRILRVDRRPPGNAVDKGFLAEAAELRQRIERDMIAAIEDFVDIGVRVDRGVGVGGTPELLENETRLGSGTCSRTVGSFASSGKSSHGEAFRATIISAARFPGLHTV